MKFDKVFELSERADKLKMLTHTFAALSAANDTDIGLGPYALCMPVEALLDLSAAIDRLVGELADEVRKEKRLRQCCNTDRAQTRGLRKPTDTV